jgi:FtsZ-binding cell division protein ZapB
MPIAKLKDQINRIKAPNVESPVPDERDEVIEKLEAALGEQRDNAAALQSSVDELDFKNSTLETSYSKQLNDARERAEAAENALTELQAELDGVGGGEDILATLATTRADLEVITAERDRLRARLRDPVGEQSSSCEEEFADSALDIDAFSVDELLEDAVWAKEQARINKERAGTAPPTAGADETAVDLVPPDLVFPANAEG